MSENARPFWVGANEINVMSENVRKCQKISFAQSELAVAKRRHPTHVKSERCVVKLPEVC